MSWATDAGMETGRTWGRWRLSLPGRGIAGFAALTLIFASSGIMPVRGASANPVIGIVPIGETPAALAVDAPTGRVFVVTTTYKTNESASGRVQVLDAATGALQETIAGEDTPNGLAVDPRSGHVFVASTGSTLVGLRMRDGHSGKLLGTLGLRGNPAPLVANGHLGRIFAQIAVPGSDGGTASAVAVVDGASGRLLQTFAVPSYIQAMGVDGVAGRVVVAGVALVHGQSTGCVRTFDSESGRLLNTVTLPTHLGFSVAVDEVSSRAFVLSESSFPFPSAGQPAVYTFDTRTGALLHTTPLPGAPLTMTLYRPLNRLFVASTGTLKVSTGYGFAGHGQVSVLDTGSGSIVSTAALPAKYVPSALLADTAHGRVYLEDAIWSGGSTIGIRGGVSSIAAGNGAILHTTTLAGSPALLGLDGPANRLFLVTGSTRTLPAAVTVLDTELL